MANASNSNESGIAERAFSLPVSKRIFDIVVCILTAWLWIPVIIICALAILVFSGWPILYVSERRMHGTSRRKIVKFRTMVKNAADMANRDATPLNGQRFLNIPHDSPLYTRVGRVIERLCFTELPQLIHVLLGHMTLVGNRPLPEDVVRALKEAYPNAEDRFLIKGGMTGPVQLVGREEIDDETRLRLEIDYCRICARAWTARLDFMILLDSVLTGLRVKKRFSAEEMEEVMRHHGKHGVDAGF